MEKYILSTQPIFTLARDLSIPHPADFSTSFIIKSLLSAFVFGIDAGTFMACIISSWKYSSDGKYVCLVIAEEGVS